jgi:hypothetical protein
MSLEALLIVTCIALCCLIYSVSSYRVVFLNLFFLPVVLSAFLLGRYGAGILALFCVICASVVVALNLNTFAARPSPLVIGLAMTAWGTVLGTTAVLVGTLGDQSARKIDELHDAYLGVMEVLVQYLNSGDARLRDRVTKLSDLSREVATRMGLCDGEVDNIRVAALLQDIENVEVTARVIQKAVGTLSRDGRKVPLEHTFHGTDLIRSFGLVLTGALPLLVDHGDCLQVGEDDDGAPVSAEPPLGTRIISTVRRYLALLSQDSCLGNPGQAIAALKRDLSCDAHPSILRALEQVVLRPGESVPASKRQALKTADNCISLLLATSPDESEEPLSGASVVTVMAGAEDSGTATAAVGAAAVRP